MLQELKAGPQYLNEGQYQGAARNMGELKGKSPWLLAYAILGPLVHAGLALALLRSLAIRPLNWLIIFVVDLFRDVHDGDTWICKRETDRKSVV